MGLLGDFFDPKDAGQAGLLNAAFSLLGSQGLGNAGLAGFQAAQNFRQNQQKQKLMDAQYQDILNQASLREAQARKMTDAQGMLDKVLNSQGAPSQYGLGGNGISMGGVSEPMKPQQGGLAGASPEQIAALKANGIDISNLWELSRFGKEMQPGYRRNADGTVSYFGDPTKGLTVDQSGTVSVMPGAAQSQATLAGATTAAQEAAKAPYSFVEQYNPTSGRMERVRLDIASASAGAPVAKTAAPAAQTPPSFQTKDPAAMRSAIAKSGDTGLLAAFDAQFPGMAPNGLAAGPSAAEKQAAAVNEKYALGKTEDVLKRRSTIFDAGDAAGGQIAQLQQLGSLLKDFNGSKYSETGVEIGKALNSIGIKVDPLLGNKEAAMSVSKKMALELRSPAGGAGMPGAMSDGDRQYLSQMAPSIANSAEGRTRIIDAAVKVQQRNQQVAQFARNYEKKYGKLDNDFFDQLSSWSRDNPLFGGK